MVKAVSMTTTDGGLHNDQHKAKGAISMLRVQNTETSYLSVVIQLSQTKKL